MRAGIWSIWFGVTGAVIAVTVIVDFNMSRFFIDAAQTGNTTFYEPLQQGMRVAFLCIAAGALWRLQSPLPVQWTWAVGGAIVILVCGVAIEMVPVLVRLGLITDPIVSLGPGDGLERRLFRLGTMASFAVPMLVVLAAGETKHDTKSDDKQSSARFATLLVHWEPILFAIGVVALPSVLIAAAFINKELTWLSPVGADTTVAACVAAAIRAHWRADALARCGWSMVCISMGIGLLMGSYSFGGPLPSPGFIGDYNALPRTFLRDSHVILMSIGLVIIAAAAMRKPHAEGLK